MAGPEAISAFCEALGIESSDEVVDALTAAIVAAHTDWPSEWLGAREFAVHLARHVDATDVVGSLEGCEVSDLFVAASALAGHREALELFDRELSSAITAALHRLGANEQERAEVGQRVRQLLLLSATEREARLHDYEGRGALRSWLRAIVGRTYLNMKRGKQREVLVDDDAVLDALHEGDADLELAHMRETYKQQFREAFHQALDALSDRQKVLLRYRFVDRVSIDKIGKIYNVHRATVHRWLAEARQELAERTEGQLRENLRLSPSEFHSIRRLVVSQLDVSLSRFLVPPDSLK